MTAAPHARAFDALEIEAEIGCVPLPVDHLDEAIRILGRAVKADEMSGSRWLIPGYLDQAADALERAALPGLAARCREDRADVAKLDEAALAIWRRRIAR